jgi:hypothetical protein
MNFFFKYLIIFFISTFDHSNAYKCCDQSDHDHFECSDQSGQIGFCKCNQNKGCNGNVRLGIQCISYGFIDSNGKSKISDSVSNLKYSIACAYEGENKLFQK